MFATCNIKKNQIKFDQFARIHLDGPKLAICKTVSDNYFRAARHKACSSLNASMLDFGYSQKLEIYDPHTHQIHPPQPHPFY